MVSPARGDRGQLQTIEGIAAAIILLSVLVIVVQAASVTPLTSSFTNQHIKLELQNIGSDILTSLDEIPSYNTTSPDAPSYLKTSITDWINVSDGGSDWYAWRNDSVGYLSVVNESNNVPVTQLGTTLSYILIKYGIAYNAEVRYSDTNGQVRNTKMIWNGDPSENSVTVSRIVVLHDDDMASPDYCVIPDISPGSNLRNTLEVRLTLWVM